jgi:hypothetical protein
LRDAGAFRRLGWKAGRAAADARDCPEPIKSTDVDIITTNLLPDHFKQEQFKQGQSARQPGLVAAGATSLTAVRTFFGPALNRP